MEDKSIHPSYLPVFPVRGLRDQLGPQTGPTLGGYSTYEGKNKQKKESGREVQVLEVKKWVWIEKQEVVLLNKFWEYPFPQDSCSWTALMSI